MKNLFKRILFLSIVVFLSSCVSPKAGVELKSERFKYQGSEFLERNAKNSVLASTETNTSTGFYIGVAFNDEALQLSDNFDIQPEVNFVFIEDFNQLKVPILARYGFADAFHVYAGPNFGFILDTPDGFKSFNFTVDAGLSYDIDDNFVIEGRYGYGLTNLIENGSSDFSSKISNFQFGLIYRLNK